MCRTRRFQGDNGAGGVTAEAKARLGKGLIVRVVGFHVAWAEQFWVFARFGAVGMGS